MHNERQEEKQPVDQLNAKGPQGRDQLPGLHEVDQDEDKQAQKGSEEPNKGECHNDD
jgi:hypothetical protein